LAYYPQLQFGLAEIWQSAFLAPECDVKIPDRKTFPEKARDSPSLSVGFQYACKSFKKWNLSRNLGNVGRVGSSC
jgi:hypothetical protein